MPPRRSPHVLFRDVRFGRTHFRPGWASTMPQLFTPDRSALERGRTAPELERDFTALLPMLWSRFRRDAEHHHAGRTCRARMRPTGELLGDCPCGDAFQSRISVTWRVVSDENAAGKLPRSAEDFARHAFVVFSSRGWSDQDRADRVAINAVADPASFRTKPLGRRMPDAVHRELLVIVLGAAGSLRRAIDPRGTAFTDYLAARLTQAGFGDLELNLERVPGMLATVRSIADEQARNTPRCCPELGALGWWSARVEHPLDAHIAPATCSYTAPTLDERPSAVEPATEHDVVERQVEADAAAGLLERGREAERAHAEGLATALGSLLFERYVAALRGGADADSSTMSALAAARAAGDLPDALCDEVLSDRRRLSLVATLLGEVVRERAIVVAR